MIVVGVIAVVIKDLSVISHRSYGGGVGGEGNAGSNDMIAW